MDEMDYENRIVAPEYNYQDEDVEISLRPKHLDEYIGQKHIVGKDSLIRRAIKVNRLGSCIFYGPPGTGKTTLANIIAIKLVTRPTIAGII